ncbi:hypothetical protein QNE90_001004 [Vibrio alginolyticus]|nr:hypothetical protein [Vibrio alginolyticus]
MDVDKILRTWGATDDQVLKITGEADPAAIEFIHEALLIAFSNPMNQSGFMGRVNNNMPFNGLTPLSYISRYPEGARRVAEHILSLGMPW